MVCPDCKGSKKHLLQILIIKGKEVKNIEACPTCKGTGAVMNKIKEEFDKWIKEQCYDYTDWSDLIKGDHEISFYIQQAFEAGNKSKDKEIEELKNRIKNQSHTIMVYDKGMAEIREELRIRNKMYAQLEQTAIEDCNMKDEYRYKNTTMRRDSKYLQAEIKKLKKQISQLESHMGLPDLELKESE